MIIVIQSSIVRVLPQIINVDGRVYTSDEDLHLLLIEHSQPTPINNVLQAIEESLALGLDLFA